MAVPIAMPDVILLAWILGVTEKIAIPAAIYRSAQGPGPESAPGVLFEWFWAPGSECPKECFECFLAFFCPQKRQKALKKHSKARCPKNTQKALWGALSGPGP